VRRVILDLWKQTFIKTSLFFAWLNRCTLFYTAVMKSISLSIAAVDNMVLRHGFYYFFFQTCHAHKCPYRVNKEPTTLLYTTLRQQLWQIQSAHTISSNFLFLHTTFRSHGTILQFFSTTVNWLDGINTTISSQINIINPSVVWSRTVTSLL